MRYSVYKQLTALSESIVDAISYVKANEKSINLLVDCVMAVSEIKEVFTQNTMELGELDSFLDIINKISDCVEKNESYSKYINDLLELAEKINLYCKNEVKYKFRILFLAELGSKWDSMDSVYKAYKNREDCEVVVVLAPIFRAIKLPNGEVKSDIIYRDYLTPLGINHISFKDYDIKKDLPDITFTSQPYESVTSEQFWAENIAPYTRLVYLPYFTVGDISCQEQRVTQCQMPIHNLAWKVLVQSEYVKSIYREHFIGEFDKLIPLGLPKWDYVVNMKNRDIQLPNGWDKLKDKKVILISYHYNAQKPELVMQSIQDLLSKVEGTDIACIIRFHPLMDTIYNVYYTGLKSRWEELKKQIDNSKNIVIDRNETYDAAFRFSDIFLTDITSLIYQYVLTKKPVVVMHGEALKSIEEKDKWKVTFIKQGKFYVTDEINNGYEICMKIFNEGDTMADERISHIQEVLPNADGKIGERISQYLTNEMLKEE